jgi:molecular chaperone DnaK (HSP70)
MTSNNELSRSLIWLLALAIPLLAALAAAMGWRGREVVVGVDLGTTFSTVAYRTFGSESAGHAHLSVMRNLASGNDTATASIIAVDGSSFLVGKAAVDFVSDDPLASVFDSKRLIGRRQDDMVAQAEILRHGGRVIPHPTVYRDAFGKVQTGSKLKLCRTCEPEFAFVVRAPNDEIKAKQLASHSCIEPGSLLTRTGLRSHLAKALDTMRRNLIKDEDTAGDADDKPTPGGVEEFDKTGIEDIEAAEQAAAEAAVESINSFLETQLTTAATAKDSRYYVLLTPTAAACIVIKSLIDNLKRELGHGQIKTATVTIPAEFNAAQRQVTVDAYTRAGIIPKRVLHEPAAAAIAYGLHKDPSIRHVLVFDMGGGTLDVSVLYAHEGAFTVIGSAGDSHLGGEDFDDCALGIIARQLKEGEEKFTLDGFGEDDSGAGTEGDKEKKNKKRQEGRKGRGRDLAAHEHGLCTHAWLKREAERVKIALSLQDSAEWTCKLPTSTGSDQTSWVRRAITRAQFEGDCSGLFNRTLEPVMKGLERANLSPQEVDEVVLVGGSSRLKRVSELLQEAFFSPSSQPNDGRRAGKGIRHTVDPDLAVAMGAALVVD